MLTRRRFIKNLSLGAAGVFMGPKLPFSPALLSAKRVICIGAGLSGLAAACQLKRKGFDVLVLESSGRIGGRVFSHPISDKLIIELGGEWVGNSHTRIQELCSEFGLKLANNQLETDLLYKNIYKPAGQWNYSDEWNKNWDKIMAGYKNLKDDDKQKLDRYDWWRFLINNGCDGRDLDIRELLDSTDFGESIRHVSAFAALAEYAESSEKNEMDLKIIGGNGMLAEKLTNAIGCDNILLKHTVTQIEQTDKVTITCANGKTFTADKIVCSLPTFSIGKIKWLPELPVEKQDANKQLQYARINKHAVQFNKRFWKRESFDLITDELPHYFYHATKNQRGPEGVLISYSIGDKAAVMANQNNSRSADMIAKTLLPHFGNIKPLIQKQVNYYWGNDAALRGAYALYGIGQWFSLRPILSAPFLHTHFAGEHIADWQGFMEGAINSGEDAALQII